MGRAVKWVFSFSIFSPKGMAAVPRFSVQFYQLLSDLLVLVGGLEERSCDKLADSFDLTASLYCMRRFLVGGDAAEFEKGISALELVMGRHGRCGDERVRQAISLLKETAYSMSQPQFQAERRGALELFEKGFGSLSWVSRHTLPERVDLLVVATLLEPELRCFIDRLGECREIVSSKNSEMAGLTYYEGLLGSDSAVPGRPIRVVALFQDQSGVTDCAASVVNGVRMFKPRMLALTGVCLGRQKMGVERLDLVVPSAAFTCDAGKHTDLGFEQESRWCEVDPRIIRRIRSKAPGMLDSIAANINSVRSGHISAPQVHTDLMACGVAIINDECIMDQMVAVGRKVVGHDMESYAFLRAAHLADPRLAALVVKGVMDFATGKPNGQKEFAAFWAAAFLAQFLVSEFHNLCPQLDL